MAKSPSAVILEPRNIKSATVSPSICHEEMGPGASLQWEIDGETVETVSDFIFGCSKITAGGDCSHEIKTF